MNKEFERTGFYQRVENKFIPPQEREDVKKALQFNLHYWVIIQTYKIDNIRAILKGDGILDGENTIGIAGPLCYICEKPYSESLALRKCRGTL